MDVEAEVFYDCVPCCRLQGEAGLPGSMGSTGDDGEAVSRATYFNFV